MRSPRCLSSPSIIWLAPLRAASSHHGLAVLLDEAVGGDADRVRIDGEEIALDVSHGVSPEGGMRERRQDCPLSRNELASYYQPLPALREVTVALAVRAQDQPGACADAPRRARSRHRALQRERTRRRSSPRSLPRRTRRPRGAQRPSHSPLREFERDVRVELGRGLARPPRPSHSACSMA